MAAPTENRPGHMLKRLFWPLKVNAAIAGFGIRPSDIDSALRTDVQVLGLEAGLTPQETALISLALVFGVLIGQAGISDNDEFDLILGTLRHDRKVDFNKPEIIDALDAMGYAIEVPRWHFDFDQEQYPYAKSPIAQLFAKKRGW